MFFCHCLKKTIIVKSICKNNKEFVKSPGLTHPLKTRL